MRGEGRGDGEVCWGVRESKGGCGIGVGKCVRMWESVAKYGMCREDKERWVGMWGGEKYERR